MANGNAAMQLPESIWNLGSCAAEGNRDALVRLWLAAPHDQLEAFWSSPLGSSTCDLVRQLRQNTQFTPAQVAMREALGGWFNEHGLSHPLSAQLMLANFLYSPPGLLKINAPEQYFPAWLVNAYLELYEAAPAPAVANSQTQLTSNAPGAFPTPDFGQFPATLTELVNNRIQLNRLLGLSNLYYIDPEDLEIRGELLTLRGQLADAINCCPEHQLEQLWATDLGDRYWAMVRSGVQKEPLAPSDERRKQVATIALTPSLGGRGFGSPGALNAFLVAMLYYVPGTMQVDQPQQKLPGWLLGPYQQIFSQPQPA
jgi:hypothetical protein